MPQQNWRKHNPQDILNNSLPELISPAFKYLIENAESAEYAEALKRQVCFSQEELVFAKNETADPLGENRYCAEPYLVHQYKNRVLLLSTGRCFSHCRYCFRRGFTAHRLGFLNSAQINRVSAYLSQHTEVKEILVSGGDPLTGSFEEVYALLTELRRISPELIIRICTRALSFAPDVFTPALLSLFKSVKPLWVIAHVNHPAELGEKQCAAAEKILESGIPIQSQSVLLNGVNGKAEILVKLFHTLTCLGIKPGYLFQGDLAYGTKHFRIPLSDALCLWKETRKELSGLSSPVFAVDLPSGGGKFPLSVLTLKDKFSYSGMDTFSAEGIDGKLYTYTT